MLLKQVDIIKLIISFLPRALALVEKNFTLFLNCFYFDFKSAFHLTACILEKKNSAFLF